MPPPVPPVAVAVLTAVVPALVVAVVVDADDVMPLEPVVLVSVVLLSLVAGAGDEKMQAAVSPEAVSANAKPAAEDASNLMSKP